MHKTSFLHVPRSRAATTVRRNVRRREIRLHMVLTPGASQRATDCSTHDQEKHYRSDQEESPDFHAEDDSWRSVIAVVDFAYDCGLVVPVMDHRVLVGRCIVDCVVVLEARDGC